jgi:anti-anti-sigma regulatory factor
LTKFVNSGNRQDLSFQSFPLALDLPFTRQGTELLRIHRTENGDVVFSLSGRIDKENIAELQELVGAEGKDRRIILDLKNMTLTGQDGITFLAQCETAGIALVNCDPYVREWITGQNNGS